MSDFYSEGNNGGDNIQLTNLGDGLVHLKVGHCCVYTIDHVLPVEWLTLVLSKAAEGDFTEPLQKSGWPKDFTDKLVAKIRHTPFGNV
jgi:hypothetical protein